MIEVKIKYVNFELSVDIILLVKTECQTEFKNETIFC